MSRHHSCAVVNILLSLCFLFLISSRPAAGRYGREASGNISSPKNNLQSKIRIASADAAQQTALVVDPATQKTVTVHARENLGPWTLMAVLARPQGNIAVFEGLKERTGSIVYVGTTGVIATLGKTAEPTSVLPETLYRGHTVQQIADTKQDLLGAELLTGQDDPKYADVAAALPPLRVPSFVGTNASDDKPTFDYGAFSDEIYVDLGKLFPEIREARAKHDVWEGLVGGWLPVNRFVFPAGDQRYWEETMFAEEAAGHFWTQPVWFRALLVDNGQLKEAHYYYHHLPFPPRGEPAAPGFYAALLHVHDAWNRDLNPPMKIDVPDKKILGFCLHAVALERITRVGDHPKYGYPPLGGINVFGGYGYNNVDTFQDTFNTSVDVFLEWGMYGIAARYIDDYFTNSVRDDGSIDTRGPEIGQYGKMLTEFGKYWAYTKDEKLMRKHQKKLEAIGSLFYSLRKQAKEVPEDDISYGIIRGWSEHDSSLKIDPYRFMQPHFSNNAEAARGFTWLGNAWIDMGKRTGDAKLATEGRRMLAESDAMKKDMETAIAKSVDRTQNPPYIPAVAGDHPTYGKERAYSEMLESGELTPEQTRIILDNLAANGQSMFGLLRYGAHLDGFLDYGPAYARIQRDWIREFLLLYDAHMAHIYSPGTWTSVESSKIDGTLGGPYCAPAEVTIPTFTKWMLVFEEPDDAVVWLAKATPRDWLAHGQKISVRNAPTRFGNVSYEIRSDIDNGRILATVRLPEAFPAKVELRLRTPLGNTMRSVKVNGRPWTDFSAERQTVTIPTRFKGEVSVEIAY